MVNFGLNSASILGIFLAVAGASLYFMRSVRPELSRDHDIFFAAVGLLCGFILLFQGWRLDPILQFGQFLLTGSTVFFAVESIRLRKVATEQARRNTPTVDTERPVSRTRVYREEEYSRDRERSIPESYNAYEGVAPNYDNPRLRGYDDPQPRPRSRNFKEEPPTTSPRRPDRYDAVEPPRPRRSRNATPRRKYDQWSEENSWDEPNYRDDSRVAKRRDRFSEEALRDRPTPEETPRRSSRRPPQTPTPASPVERPRRFSKDDLGTSYDENLGTSYEEDLGSSYTDDYTENPDVISTDYVEYQPLEDLGTSYDDAQYDDSEYPDSEDSQPRQPSSDWDEPRNRKNPPDYDY